MLRMILGDGEASLRICLSSEIFWEVLIIMGFGFMYRSGVFCVLILMLGSTARSVLRWGNCGFARVIFLALSMR